ncbi:MFS transporter [Dinghuibacter silviterrae]|uniref:Fucose permease n=1 Tax=Dinghuibacter silviterrae TaxID=1539049 RepID=A0A4R8DGP5_9BACT|nr:MFS transporter [Dinghuibacter silviterrae]TDW96833.1 fucose permease [Dinghuibacter silviterrae]
MIKLRILPLNDRRSHRAATGALFFLSGLCNSSWASRIPTIQQNLKLSDGAMGGVLMAAPVGLMLSLPVAGWLIQLKGSRLVAGFSAVTYISMLQLLGMAPSTALLVSSLLLFGFSGNLLNISMNTQAVEVEALYGRTIMASFHGLWSLASFTGALVGTAMMAVPVTPTGHFLIIGAVAVTLMALSFPRLLPAQEVAEDVKKTMFAKPDRSLVALGLVALLVMICEGAMADWSGIFFKKIVRVSPSSVGLGYASFTCTMAFGRFVADGLVTRIGMKKVLQGSGLLITAGLVLAVAVPQLPTAVLGMFLVGLGSSSVVPLILSTAGKSKTVSAGMALASISTISFMGLLFGPPLIGFIAGATSLRVSFLFLSLMGLFIAGTVARMRE